MTAGKAGPRRKTLGRGLSALFGEEDAGEDLASLDKLRLAKMVPVEFLRPSRVQPRRHFDAAALAALTDSVREKGVLEPIVVRRHPDQANAYEIVAGERRWRAAQGARLHEVPVVVKELSDRDALEIALIENIHREDLTALEEADGYQRLMDEFGHTQDALSRSVGKSRSHVANMLRLLALPEAVKQRLHDGSLSAGHARALLTAENAEALAAEIVAKGLNVRQTEQLVQRGRPQAEGRQRGRARKAEAAKDPNTAALERDLGGLLGLRVRIEERGAEGGTLMIHYDTLEQLDDVLRRITRKTTKGGEIVEV